MRSRLRSRGILTFQETNFSRHILVGVSFNKLYVEECKALEVPFFI